MQKIPSARAMSSWFLDEGHVVIPVVKHRLCFDYLVFTLSWMMSLLSFFWSVAATYLQIGASPYPFAIACINLISFFWLFYGDWSVGNKFAPHTYFYMFGMWCLVIAWVWTASAFYVDVRAAQEFMEENWLQKATETIIPFTTLLDMKNMISTNAKACLGIAICGGIFHLQGVLEAWRALGGMIRLVQLKFSIMLLVYFPMFVLAIISASYSIVGAEIAVFATNHSTSIMLWQAAISLFIVFFIFFIVVARSVWGITFSSHAVSGLFGIVLSFVLFVISMELWVRSSKAEDFVSSNWQSLKYLVPSYFAPLQWDKYMLASETPMRLSAMTGIMLSVMMFYFAFVEFRSAAVVLTVGTDLYVARARLQALHSEILDKMHHLFNTGITPVPMEGDRPIIPADAFERPPEMTLSTPAPTHVSDLRTPVRPQTPLGGHSRGYGSLADVKSPDSETGLLADEATHRREVSAELSKNVRTQLPQTYIEVLQRRLAAAQQYKYLMKLYEHQLEEMNKRVISPTFNQFKQTLISELRQMFSLHRMCFIMTFFAIIIIIGGIGGGLQPLTTMAQCGALARHPVSRVYNVSFFLETNGMANIFSTVHLENDFPFGGIDVRAEHGHTYIDSWKESWVSLEAIAVDERDLPSMEELRSWVNISDYFNETFTDDDHTGFRSLVVKTQAPANARQRCLGLRLVFWTENPQLITFVKSSSAMVNITGNVHDLDSNSVAPYDFQTLTVETDSAPIVIINGYIDRVDLDPNQLPFAPSTVLTSNSGSIFMSLLFSSGLSAKTGGNINALSVAMFSASHCTAICGDLYLETSGWGNIVYSKILGAYMATFKADRGDVTVANSVGAVGQDFLLTSNAGSVVASSLIMGYNNRTFMHSGKQVKLSMFIGNQLIVDLPSAATFSAYEVFLGLPAGGDAFLPKMPQNYSAPAINITSDMGDITLVGLSSYPADDYMAHRVSSYLYSEAGNVKVEINGGGVYGPYEARSDLGHAVVELDGLISPLSGQLYPANVGINNSLTFYSRRGNVQLSLMPNSV